MDDGIDDFDRINEMINERMKDPGILMQNISRETIKEGIENLKKERYLLSFYMHYKLEMVNRGIGGRLYSLERWGIDNRDNDYIHHKNCIKELKLKHKTNANMEENMQYIFK
jgi:hypothetical protein